MTDHYVRPGDVIRLQDDRPPVTPTPGDIMTFLSMRGWKSEDSTHVSHEAKGRHWMSWEQAMACEFYEFITIGGR